MIKKLLTGALGLVFDTAKGRALALAAAVLGLFGWFVVEQRNVGARNVVQEVNQSAAKITKQAREARARVPDSGNAKWLQRHFCRDC